MSANSNCLEGCACPSCGQSDLFRVAAFSVFEVTDEGTYDHFDVNWEDDASTWCGECEWKGVFGDLRKAADKLAERRERLMPGGVPRYVRIYDNGGGMAHFCRRCLTFQDPETCEGCGKKLLPVPADSGTCDRYTVVYTGRYRGRTPGKVAYRGMSCRPSHPQGVSMWGEGESDMDCGEAGFPVKLGEPAPFGRGDRRISFKQLPDDCKQVALRDYKDLWEIQ